MTYSIITINFNNKEGLKKTIESVIHQTYRDFEYIVIDGGSTDGSVELLKEYDKQIDYWVSEPDSGIYQGMNKGIVKSTGNYLNFMNSGDTFYSNKVLAETIDFLKCDIVHGRLFDRSRNCFPYLISQTPTMRYFYESSIQHPSCFIKRSLFDNMLYDEHFRIVSDWKFFIQQIIFENCSFSFMPIIVASFEGEGLSVSQQFEAIHKAERAEVLSSLLPPRILADYERYANKESPVLDLIPEFNKTWRLQIIIIKQIRINKKIYKLYLLIKNYIQL